MSTSPTTTTTTTTTPSSLPTSHKVILYGPAPSDTTTNEHSIAPVEEWRSVPALHNNNNSHNVLVKVCAAGLNPVDAKNVIGDKLPHSWKTAHKWTRKYIDNKVPGFDFSGIVVATPAGKQDEEYKVGDAVFGTVPPFCGTLAQYIVAPVHQITHKPDNWSHAAAAALPLVGLTAQQCLDGCCLTTEDKQKRPMLPTPVAREGGATVEKVAETTKVLVLGASGGTGHVFMQVAHLRGATSLTAVCSTRTSDFCQKLVPDEVNIVTYNGKTADELVEALAVHGPYRIVIDCVTSADPVDTDTIHYPVLLQEEKNRKLLLTDDYEYRRLGGQSPDWLRAGAERSFLKLNLWPNAHEKLFWIRFPHSANDLRQLAAMDTLRAQVAQEYEFSSEGVQQAMDALLSRRVQGKVVVRIAKAEEDENPKE